MGISAGRPRGVGSTIFAITSSRSALSITSTASKMVSRAGSFLVVAPLLGAGQQGHLVLYSAWSAITTLVSAFGLQVKVLRDLPLSPNSSYGYVKTDLLSILTLSLPAAGLAILAGCWLTPIDQPSAYTLIFISTLCSVAIDYISCALRAIDCFKEEAILSIFSALAQFCLMVGACLYSATLTAVSVSLLLSRVLVLFVSLIGLFSRPIVALSKPARVSSGLLRNIRDSATYFIDASLTVAVTQIDVVVLGYYATKEAVGVYGAGSRLVMLFLTIPWMITNIFVPRIMGARDRESLRGEEIRLTAALVLCGIGAVSSLLVIAPLIATRYLGASFKGVDGLWPYFALLVAVRFIEAGVAIFMLIRGYIAARALAQAFSIIIIMGLGSMLIPSVGIKGLIITLSAASAMASFFYLFLLNRSSSAEACNNGLELE